MSSRVVQAVVVLFVATVFVVGFQARPAYAATRTWTGLGASSNWSDAGNWDSGAPVAGDTVVFPQNAQRKTNINNIVGLSLFRIRFDGSGYDISGNGVDVTEDLTNQPGDSGSNTARLDIGGTGDVLQLSGRLILTGANSYLGGTTVQGGVLLAASDDALGGFLTGTTVLAPATLQVSGGVDIQNEVITITGIGFDTNGALQSLSDTNFIEFLRLADDATVGVGNSTLVVEELAQDASGAFLTLVGSGKLQIETSFYAGALTVESGNLTWNASSQAFVDVHHDGLIRGTGMVSAINVAGGRVYPGSGQAPGILSVFTATTFTAGRFQVDLDGPAAGLEYGQLKTSGITLNALATLLQIDLTFTPSVGQVFRIIDNVSGAPVSGTFHDLPEGAIIAADGQALQISYTGGDGNDVTLTVLRQLSADLRLAAEASPSPVAAGNTLVYTVTVTNFGPDVATTPTVSVGTPVGTTYESVQAPAGWTCSKPTGSPTVQCLGPSMASGVSAQFIFRFKVNAGAAGPILATAAVSSNTNDPASANNAASISTPVGSGGGQLPFRRALPGLAADSAGATTQG